MCVHTFVVFHTCITKMHMTLLWAFSSYWDWALIMSHSTKWFKNEVENEWKMSEKWLLWITLISWEWGPSLSSIFVYIISILVGRYSVCYIEKSLPLCCLDFFDRCHVCHLSQSGLWICNDGCEPILASVVFRHVWCFLLSDVFPSRPPRKKHKVKVILIMTQTMSQGSTLHLPV